MKIHMVELSTDVFTVGVGNFELNGDHKGNASALRPRNSDLNWITLFSSLYRRIRICIHSNLSARRRTNNDGAKLSAIVWQARSLSIITEAIRQTRS
jgi:hypothetical protein